MSGGAAVATLGFGLRRRHITWSLLGLYFALLATSTSLRWINDGPGAVEWQLRVADGALLVGVSVLTVFMWLMLRPLVTDQTYRSDARRLTRGAMLLLTSAALLDARLSAQLKSTELVLLLVIISGAGVVLATPGLARLTRQASADHRYADAFALAAFMPFFIVHLTGMFTGNLYIVHSGSAIYTLTAMIAVSVPSAEQLSQRLPSQQAEFRRRPVPILLAVFVLGAAYVALIVEGRGPLRLGSALLVVAAAAAMLWAGREIAGPGKPLVFPFGARDRALQRLPDVLFQGDVRLVGQPVRRPTDHQIVGIQARPEWTTDKIQIPIEVMAADADLESLLDSVTIELAQAHLPAVLASLDADEPFLSVPLICDPDAALGLDDLDAIDGLVLRVSSEDLARTLDPLREYGAQLQVPEGKAADLDPEFVQADPSVSQGATPASLRLVVASDLIGPAAAKNVNLIVDDALPPTSLAAILSPIGDDDGTVTQIEPSEL